MNTARLLLGSIAAISTAAPLGLCQVLVSAPAQDAPTDQECLAPKTTQPSPSAARCEGLARTSGLMDAGNNLFATIGVLGGYDSAFDSKQGLNAPFEGGVLFAGFLSQKNKTSNLFENTASLLNYHTNGGVLQYLDIANVSLAHQPSPRNIVGFSANNVFGNDAIRVVELGGSNVNVEAPSYGIYPGKVLDNQATFRWTHQSTETRWLAVSIRNNFRDLIDDDSQVNTLHARMQLQYQPSPRAGIGLFEETAVETGAVDCSTQSFGLVYERRLSRTLAVEGAAAPAFGTKSCGQRLSANLYGSLSAKPGRSTELWVSGYRKLNDSWYAPLTFESNVQGGWLQSFGLHNWLKVRGGWVGGTVPSQKPQFNGAYVASSFGRRLAGGLSASLSFQHFNWSGVTSIAPTRTFVSAALYWSPNAQEPDQIHGPVAH